MITCGICAAAQDGFKALSVHLTRIWRALRRFNSVGIGGADRAVPRAVRAQAFRAALADRYRDSSPCC